MKRVTELLTPAEIRELTRPSNARAALELGATWGLVALAFAASLLVPHPLMWVVTVIVLGGRQLALAVLMHECSHRALFGTRRANDQAGRWLAGALVWSDVHRYRTHHLAHHAHAGTERDPDLGLIEPFPTTRASLARKVLRDLTGVAGLRRIAALVLIDLGLVSYTASTGARWVGRNGRSVAQIAVAGARHLGPVVVTNVALWALLAAFGAGWLYLLWVVAWLTTFSLFLRVRSIAEHACTDRDADPWRNTRTTRASPIARLLVAPHHVNHHIEHHLLMTVPCYRLAALHRLLRERGGYDGATAIAPGYFAVLATAGGRVRSSG